MFPSVPMCPSGPKFPGGPMCPSVPMCSSVPMCPSVPMWPIQFTNVSYLLTDMPRRRDALASKKSLNQRLCQKRT